jgi:hypothetical protein
MTVAALLLLVRNEHKTTSSNFREVPEDAFLSLSKDGAMLSCSDPEQKVLPMFPDGCFTLQFVVTLLPEKVPGPNFNCTFRNCSTVYYEKCVKCSSDFCEAHRFPSAHSCFDENSFPPVGKEVWFEPSFVSEKKANVKHCGAKKTFVLRDYTTFGCLLKLMYESSQTLGTNLLAMPEFAVLRRKGTSTELHNSDLDPKQVVLELFEVGMDAIDLYVAVRTC